MTLGVPEGDPLASLAAALEPFGWFTHDLQAVTRLDGGFPWWSAEFTGCLARAPGEPLPRSQREGRRAMYEQAEAVITAARDAGWVTWKPPEIEIGGDLIHRGGKPPQTLPTCRVRMQLVPVAVFGAQFFSGEEEQ